LKKELLRLRFHIFNASLKQYVHDFSRTFSSLRQMKKALNGWWVLS